MNANDQYRAGLKNLGKDTHNDCNDSRQPNAPCSTKIISFWFRFLENEFSLRFSNIKTNAFKSNVQTCSADRNKCIGHTTLFYIP